MYIYEKMYDNTDYVNQVFPNFLGLQITMQTIWAPAVKNNYYQAKNI